MKLVVGSDGWNGNRFRSAFTYSNGVLMAARAAGLDAQPYALPQHYGARLGGLLLPWAHSLVSRYDVEPGTLIHQTTHGAWHGVHVATVLDAYAFHYDRSLPGRFRRSAVRASVRRAQRVVALSEAGARDLGRVFPAQREKIRWARVAFAATGSGRGKRAYDALWVGATGERKNPRAYLALASRFPQRRFAIRIHGGPADLPLGPNVVVLPPQEDLDPVYRSAPVLVVTSTFEGFHMPAMEAYLRGSNLVLPRLEPLLETYESDDAKVFWYDPADEATRLAEAYSRAAEAPLAPPKAEIVRSVSYEEVGRRLRSIYEEVQRR